MEKKIIEVVAGVLTRPDGDFMLGSRPEGKPYAGYWEFPGGKVEAGESWLEALARELQEEMGILLTRASYWQTRVHHYEHASVRLRFFRVWEWQGELKPLEGQAFSWMHPGELNVAPMLPANGPILKALTLPAQIAITCSSRSGVDALLRQLSAADAPLLVEVHEPQMSREQLHHFCLQIVPLVHAYGGKVLVQADPLWLQGWPVDGVHLSAEQLMRQTQRPDFPWVGASVHDAAQLEQAGLLALDYAQLGPVCCPETEHALGWERFTSLLEVGVPLPVYAQGRLSAQDLASAQAHGAHGIAAVLEDWS
jgi:8-oxo-dGTP diphosphatase